MKPVKRIKLPERLFISSDRIKIEGDPDINIDVRFTADVATVRKLVGILSKKIGKTDMPDDADGFFLSEDQNISGVMKYTGLIVLPLNTGLNEIAHEASHAAWYISERKVRHEQIRGAGMKENVQESMARHTGHITSIVRCIQDAVFFNHTLKGRMTSA
jgi:hypothetical protein